MLNWLQQFSIFCWLDNCSYAFEQPAFETMVAAGAVRELRVNDNDPFGELARFHAQQPGWLFGHLAYNLQQEITGIKSALPDEIGFDDLYFFEPEIRIRVTENRIYIAAPDAAAVFNAIRQTALLPAAGSSVPFIQARMNREAYLQAIRILQEHIHRGDCYEINYCQEFFARDVSINPAHIYQRLMEESPNPFSAFYKYDDTYCICASPERYLKKTGQHLLSQPIKGTSPRNHNNAAADAAAKQYLLQSQKEKSENVMVVDLVRNDLGRVCLPGTVTVDELFGVYSFPQVHQLISSISGELDPQKSFTAALAASFPMGSMTGAPKKRVMELVEQYEKTKRGLFSGAIGYITPAADFDFNVVIRSIFFNAGNSYLSFQVGSGITFYSEPEKEYEECLLKATAIKKILST